MRASVLVLATVMGIGCGGEPPPPQGKVALVLGGADPTTGQWVTLTDGQDAELVPGAQGGFHVWMKLRLGHMEPQRLRAAKTAHRVGDGQLVLRSSLVFDVGAPDDTGVWELPMATPMFMCPSPIGLSVIDQPISFEIELSDEAGARVAGSSVRLVPHCPAEGRDFCLKICTG